MITKIKGSNHYTQYFGLSSDTKPLDANNASAFFEMDTGKEFLFDRENGVWRNKADGTPVASGALITFTVSGKEYTAEEGMTWSQFIESGYNPQTECSDCGPQPLFSNANGGVFYGHEHGYFQFVTDGSPTPYAADEMITAGMSYEVDTAPYCDICGDQMGWNGSWYCINGCGGNADLITFTVNGTEYTAEPGMTWQDFNNSEYNPKEEFCCTPNAPVFFDQAPGEFGYVYYKTCQSCWDASVVVAPDGTYRELPYQEIISGGVYTTKMYTGDDM